NVLALFHLAGEALLVGGGKQEDLADLPQVHADRVVDALLVLEGDGRGRFALFVGVGELYVWLRPDVTATASVDDFGDKTEGIFSRNLAGGNTVAVRSGFQRNSVCHKPTFSKRNTGASFREDTLEARRDSRL